MPVWPATAEHITQAADRIRAGGLVAFPTETVYGLGANALNAQAVEKIFIAKGRPSFNPVIVHVADVEQARGLTRDWTPSADKLAAAYWPGPLTLVLRRSPVIPDNVTAGGDTVGIRCPNHPIARELIRRSGVPIAAPSANKSSELSPTRAGHVVKAFGDSIVILDGGPCSIGIESTVVDVSGPEVQILRSGLITPGMIRECVGPITTPRESAILRSPGMLKKHYAPRTRVELHTRHQQALRAQARYANEGKTAIIITLGVGEPGSEEYILPDDPSTYARQLYSTLHAIDEAGADVILVVLPPDRPEWQAVRDRLIRAAAMDDPVAESGHTGSDSA